jgi:homoserine kinase
MTNDSKEEIYAQAVRSGKQVPKALGLGLVSAASAIAGGLAVAWWYRKTLTKLQNPIVFPEDSKPEFVESDPHS